MKFSITFKYSNVTFKNKDTKETVIYDSKAEGNTFTFDNVDEDVVLGIVKGIKDKKASQVFAYDNFRTNFVNVIARNKCKELYDKLDKGGWKVEDIAISNITIKDLEFTKPTMNAREVITVESKNKARMNEDFKDTVNKALNATLTRTVNTSVSTLLPMLAIAIFGGESIRGLSVALCLGIVIGTYASIMIGTPIMVDTVLRKKEVKK